MYEGEGIEKPVRCTSHTDTKVRLGNYMLTCLKMRHIPTYLQFDFGDI